MRKRFLSTTSDEEFDEPIINLTPLIDVVFVVLITFMLIAPVLDTDSVNLAQGGGAEKNEVKPSPISISVRADNSIWYQGKNRTLPELTALLKQEIKQKPHATPQLIHDKQAQFGVYQSLKNTLESIGFEQMDVILM